MRFFEVLNHIIVNKEENTHQELIVKSEKKYYKISKNNIINVESDKNYQYCYMKDGTVLKVRMTMQQLYELLEDETRFAKCGASYIINWDYVTNVSAKFVELHNQKLIPVPRGGYLPLKEKYFAYYCVQEND